MVALIKTDSEDKKHICERVYEDYLLTTSDFIISCDEISEILRAYIPSGCYTNFRDALFHFRCLVYSNNESEIVSQVASIKEHTNRAMRDAEVAICQRYMGILKIIRNGGDMQADIKEKLDSMINSLQECILNLRLGGMMLKGMDSLGPSPDDFLIMINDFCEFLNSKLAKQFQNATKYFNDLKIRLKNSLASNFTEKEYKELKSSVSFNDVADLVYEAIYN